MHKLSFEKRLLDRSRTIYDGERDFDFDYAELQHNKWGGIYYPPSVGFWVGGSNFSQMLFILLKLMLVGMKVKRQHQTRSGIKSSDSKDSIRGKLRRFLSRFMKTTVLINSFFSSKFTAHSPFNQLAHNALRTQHCQPKIVKIYTVVEKKLRAFFLQTVKYEIEEGTGTMRQRHE